MKVKKLNELLDLALSNHKCFSFSKIVIYSISAACFNCGRGFNLMTLENINSDNQYMKKG